MDSAASWSSGGPWPTAITTRVETGERRPRRLQPRERVHAEQIAAAGQVEACRAERLGADQQPAVGQPQQRFPPAAALEHRALLDAVHRDPAAAEGDRRQPGSTQPLGHRGGIALVAVEQRDDADHGRKAGQQRVQPVSVDRVDHQRPGADHDRA